MLPTSHRDAVLRAQSIAISEGSFISFSLSTCSIRLGQWASQVVHSEYSFRRECRAGQASILVASRIQVIYHTVNRNRQAVPSPEGPTGPEHIVQSFIGRMENGDLRQLLAVTEEYDRVGLR
jgi:hypothetical protein